MKTWQELVERKYVSCELTTSEAKRFSAWLKDMHIQFESSECYGLVHFECYVSTREMQMANDFIDGMEV